MMIKGRHILLPVVWILSMMTVQAQPDFKQIDYLQVFKGSRAMLYPWGGGLNSAQFADPDLNNDGIADLVAYEKTEDRLLTFIADGNGRFRLDRAYAQHIPTVSGWLVTKDINCDGIDDFFTYSNASIKVFHGFYEQDTLKFRLFSDGIFYQGFGGKINLYSTFVDRPAIADFDNDGDLDILTFNVTFTRMQLYRNLRVEKAFNCDTLAFKLEDNCWGNIMEDGLSALVKIRDTCPDKFPFPERRNPYEDEFAQRRHAGSTLEAFDISNNGRKDILMGDVSFSFVNYLRNSGTLENASVLQQDTAYPRYDTPVKLFSFPLAYFTDINQDGRKDLLVTPFEGFGVDNINNVWYYKNIDTDSVKLQLQTKSFMVGDMIDAGENAVPCLIDVDGDGLKDLLVGGGYRLDGNDPVSRILLYRNTGTADYPVFSLTDEDYLSFNATGFNEPYPAAGDLDGDGREDIVVGLGDGRMLFYRNTTNGGFQPAAPALLRISGSDIDVGQNAAPAIVDIDRDNKNDLLVGERNGNINYYRNIGTPGNIQLVFQTDSVGKIRTSTQFIPFGNSAPAVADVNSDGKWDLVFGGYENILSWVSNIQDSLFQRVTPQPLIPDYSGLIGRKIAPVLAELTDDGKWELILGLQAGGLNFFSEDPPPFRPVRTRDFSLQNAVDFEVFPNPASQMVNIRLNNYEWSNSLTWEALDVSGRMHSNGWMNDSVIQIHLAQWPKGVYLIRLTDQNGFSGVKKLVIY
jgi:hypothetical protein